MVVCAMVGHPIRQLRDFCDGIELESPQREELGGVCKGDYITKEDVLF